VPAEKRYQPFVVFRGVGAASFHAAFTLRDKIADDPLIGPLPRPRTGRSKDHG
jgi:hypothetical protein